jgi:hypothetical protein
MKMSIQLAVCAVAFVCVGGALAQTPDSAADESRAEASTAPVAFVYVGNTNNTLDAFAVAANGRLTKVPGSPYKYTGFPEAVNGKYLFGREPKGTIVDSFLMESNGALKLAVSTNIAVDNPTSCAPNEGALKVDHSGESLYNLSWDSCDGQSTTMRIETFNINDANGDISYLSESDGFSAFDPSYQIAFLGNNQYGYLTQFNFLGVNEIACGISWMQRPSNGELVNEGYGNPGPAAPPIAGTTNYYCPVYLATDPTDHVVALLQPTNGGGGFTGPLVLGVYTADVNGNLTTTNTSLDMPEAPAGATSIRMSPSGKYLAVGGQGVEIFHFNGAAPLTKYKTVLPASKYINQMVWDNNNHLFVTTLTDSKNLYVYTVTSTGITEAPGSPYTVYFPTTTVVQTKQLN